MKKLLVLILTITALAAVAASQAKDENEILKIHKGLERAYVNGEITPFEAILSDDYLGAFPNGKGMTRAELLDDMRKEHAKPTFKVVSDETDNVKIKVIGDAAYVTSDWTSVSLSTADPKAKPHTDKGRYTGIYEKRGGKWLLVAEHFSEMQHDRKIMEQEVIAASNAYDEAVKRRDAVAYERLLHADYIFTNEDGKTVSRTDDIAHVASADTVIASIETMDKKVRILGNTSALETGVYHATGTRKGKPFDETGRYTTVWLWRDFRWQITADHVTTVKK